MPRHAGFALLELIVAVLIATLLAVWGAATLVNRIDDAAAQASAAWMLSVRAAVHDYARQYADRMIAAADADALLEHGYLNWQTPQLAELKADGLLSAGFPERGAYGLQIAIQIVPNGICPGEQCRLEALIYSAAAVTRRKTSRVDEQMIAQWLIAAQGMGGTVSDARPGLVAGAAFAMPNPPVGTLDPLPAGTIAMAITSSQLNAISYLRVGDSRDPDFKGAATVQGDISTEGTLSAQHYVRVGKQERASTACSDDGAIAREQGGGLLVCRSRKWRSAGRGGGGGFMKSSDYNCATSAGAPTANPMTGACTCPIDYEILMISDSGPPHPGSTERIRGYLCVQ